jgi:nucleotide-binding universal stress UspA family protein
MSDAPIVVATDLSARSDRAIDRALLIGREQSRPVIVVHVVESKHPNAEELAQCEALVRSVLPEPETGAEIVLPCGPAPDAIAQTAQERRAALLVAGVARLNQLRDYITGTAVDRILRAATMPVLVVKTRPHRPYRRLLAATDFSEPSKEAILAAARLFPDARIEVLHAYHVPFEGWQNTDDVREEFRQTKQAELDRFLADPELAAIGQERLSGRICYGSLENAVSSAIAEMASDLLVLGTHGESGFRHATIGSNANTLLDRAPVDTLMVPAPQ